MPSLRSMIPLSALALASVSSAAVLPDTTADERYLVRRALNTGMGTRYGDDCTEEDCWQGGACSFVDYTLPEGVDGSTCVSEDIWNQGANCGGCISVSYKGKKITVMVRPTEYAFAHASPTECIAHNIVGDQHDRRRQEPP